MIKDTSKTQRKIVDTSVTQRRVDPQLVAEKLGAEITGSVGLNIHSQPVPPSERPYSVSNLIEQTIEIAQQIESVSSIQRERIARVYQLTAA